jgi:hypothetical protein
MHSDGPQPLAVAPEGHPGTSKNFAKRVLVPFFALANEHHPDPEMRPYKEAMSSEQREQLIVAAGVIRIYDYFEAHRLIAGHAIGDSATHRRIASKVGRNEPCPCGSGKKFKHCCGRVTLH